jgi:hypothetical protein
MTGQECDSENIIRGIFAKSQREDRRCLDTSIRVLANLKYVLDIDSATVRSRWRFSRHDRGERVTYVDIISREIYPDVDSFRTNTRRATGKTALWGASEQFTNVIGHDDFFNGQCCVAHGGFDYDHNLMRLAGDDN